MKALLTNTTDQPVTVKMPPVPQFFTDDPVYSSGAFTLFPHATDEWVEQMKALLPAGVTLEILDETKEP